MIEIHPNDAMLKVGISSFQDETMPTDLSNGCMVYRQEPPEKDTDRTRDRIQPDELFSMFTADIIEKNTVFVR